ncbi:hypothetical protein ALC62_11438 [Cyphomyrmex costatus]|uniref:Uncharacterized protein n=1 Tax=Cyphomyrmex costatus TaxID=456900 RepID=A0A195CBB3_9HYME|nr:hypothetical protein ALC62_11438 [Cyphomyrmex costatus]
MSKKRTIRGYINSQNSNSEIPSPLDEQTEVTSRQVRIECAARNAICRSFFPTLALFANNTEITATRQRQIINRHLKKERERERERKRERESEREPERKRSVASPRVEEEADARGVSFTRRGIEGRRRRKRRRRRLKNSERH